jgi:chromosome segregation ATPase
MEGSDRLGFLEAERIIAILEDTTEKMSFLDSITPDVLQHRDELSKFIGDEIARTLLEQKNLEKKYEELIEQRAAMKGMVNKNKYKEVQEEIQDVSRALRESTNNLVRSLKENPNISGNLIKVQRDRTELNDVLLRCIQELRDRGRYQTITHKVDEENNARIRFQQLKSREKGLREAVARLKETLNEENRAFQRTTTEQKQAILQLKEELLQVKGSTSTDARFRRKESLASVSAIWREYKHKEHQLEIRLKELEDRLHTENIVNGETKDFLTRKHAALAESVNTWDAKYETEIGEIDGDIAATTARRNALLEKLEKLQARRHVDVEQEAASETAQAQEKERLRLEKIAAKRANIASRTIQRELRAFVKRKKELDAIRGDGKKKKAGGKGDKKKK